MIIKKVILFIVLLTCLMVSSQSAIDSVFLNLRVYDIEKAQEHIDKLKNLYVKTLFEHKVTYYKTGKLPLSYLDSISYNSLNVKEELALNILHSDYLGAKQKIISNDSLSKRYLSAFQEAKALKDTVLLTEVLLKFNRHLLYRCRDASYTEQILGMYENYRNASLIDAYYCDLLIIGYKFMLTENNFGTKDLEQLEVFFAKCFSNPVIHKYPMLEATLHQNYGIYLSHWVKDYKQANTYNERALEIYKTIPYWFAQKGIKGLDFNRHVNLYKNGDYEKAIPFFKKDLKRDKEPLMVMFTYEWLYKCYEGLHKSDSALFYFKRMHEVKAQLDQKAHAREILKIEATYNYEDKVKALEQTSKKVASLESRLLGILPVFGLVSLLLVVSFYFYKRYKNKSTVLEGEQSETLKKLDELKAVVIKNHIVLKDKTKVYVSDLMYVKSEDHYINIFTANGKQHLVRGKLSKMQDELPPNFIRCHRSYIVNSNFIKQVNASNLVLLDNTQIPLSRSYKDKF